MRIVEIRDVIRPIASPIGTVHIDLSKLTTGPVVVVTDGIRDGEPVVGCGCNSNGRTARCPTGWSSTGGRATCCASSARRRRAASRIAGTRCR